MMQVKIFTIKKQSGPVFAFEISKPIGGRRRVCSVLRKISGVKLLKTPRFMSGFREEVFCEFELGQVQFQVLEAFGDNSRYWIGPKDYQWHPEIEMLLQAFSGGGDRSSC